jgi:hypothetical protein
LWSEGVKGDEIYRWLSAQYANSEICTNGLTSHCWTSGIHRGPPGFRLRICIHRTVEGITKLMLRHWSLRRILNNFSAMFHY